MSIATRNDVIPSILILVASVPTVLLRAGAPPTSHRTILRAAPCNIQRSPRHGTPVEPRNVHAQHGRRTHHRRMYQSGHNQRHYGAGRVWDGWHGQGERRRWRNAQAVSCARLLLNQTAQVSSVARDTQRPTPRSPCLISTPSPSPDSALDCSTAPVCNPFTFVNKSKTLDRDRVVVPADWDS